MASISQSITMLLSGLSIFINLWLLLRYARLGKRHIPALRYCLGLIAAGLMFSLLSTLAFLVPAGPALDFLVGILASSGPLVNTFFFLTVIALIDDRESLLYRLRRVIIFIPWVLLPLYFTNNRHHWLLHTVQKDAAGFIYSIQYGPLAYLVYAYSLLLSVMAIWHIFRSRHSGLFNQQWIRWALVIVITIPSIMTALQNMVPALEKIAFGSIGNWIPVAIVCHLFFGYLFKARQVALELVGDVYVAFDFNGHCVDINPEGKAFFERHTGSGHPTAASLEALLEHPAQPGGATQELHLKDGRQDKYYQLTGFGLSSGLNQACGTGYVIHEVTEYMNQMSRLNTIATEDPLTHAKNRRYLAVSGSVLFQKAAEDGAVVSIMMIDVDFFKRVNDTHGHAVGDEILVQLYTILRDNVRDEDCVVRYGGEEFLVMCRGLGYEAAFNVAERIRGCVAGHSFPTAAGPLEITVSVGVYSGIPQGDDTLEGYTEAADHSLYQAKNSGRNRVM